MNLLLRNCKHAGLALALGGLSLAGFSQTLAASGGPGTPLPREAVAPFLQITGRVTSDEGQGMPGVNILVKEAPRAPSPTPTASTRSTQTATPRCSFPSSASCRRRCPWATVRTIDVTLKADVKQLGEVVVTALGIKKKPRKLGYATATVAPEQITVNRTPNFMNALQGKMAGVNITSLGTGPAGTSKIASGASRRSAAPTRR
jgi:hypothetical protein